MNYTADQFPNNEAFIIGSSVSIINSAFNSAHKKYGLIEAFSNTQNSVGNWYKEENAELALKTVRETKEFEHNLVYMAFDRARLGYLKQVVMGEISTLPHHCLPEGVEMDITLPESSNQMIKVTLKFK